MASPAVPVPAVVILPPKVMVAPSKLTSLTVVPVPIPPAPRVTVPPPPAALVVRSTVS